ncbi:MAG TPA: EAL domain-containing protein [Thermoanaerobaculia bacterium]|nr:EAL domain-containing protein [Thermoanaerobaculia bacterium]
MNNDRAEQVLKVISRAFSAGRPEEFFASLVRNLAESVGGDFAWVGELNPTDRSITTLAVTADGEPAPNFTYGLGGTPCEAVVDTGGCYVPQGAWSQFPSDEWLSRKGIESYLGSPLQSSTGEVIGLQVVVARRALADPELAHNLMSVFAARTAAEVERLRNERALHESEDRFRSLFESAAIGLAIVDVDARPLDVNAALVEMLGYDRQEFGLQTFSSFTHQDDIPIASKLFNELVAGSRNQYTVEKRYIRKDGTLIWGRQTGSVIRNEEGRPRFIVNMIENINDRKLAEQKLEFQSLHDQLTALPNRSLFENRLEHSLRRIERRERGIAILLADVDSFRLINDSLSHSGGDQVLTQIAHRLESCVRPGDTVARFGGDDFGIILEDIGTVESAQEIADRLLKRMTEPFMVGQQELYSSLSIGVAMADDHSPGPEELLRAADIALHRAKSDGKACHRTFLPGEGGAPTERLILETDLRHALERKELFLMYQPIIDLSTGRMSGAEALLRWAHPSKGMISPMHFIPIAEELGLIVPIGLWVLEQATRWASGWPHVQISVNLSARQFREPGLVGDIQRTLSSSGLEPTRLKVEITETAAMLNPEASAATLRRLKELGVEVAIDDFGTGYSSLAYLKRFPLDTLKIDRAFVSGLGRNDEDESIVQAIISLARALDLSVTAEGVETSVQLDVLLRLGCTTAQGYYFAKPLTEEEILKQAGSDKVWSAASARAGSILEFKP